MVKCGLKLLCWIRVNCRNEVIWTSLEVYFPPPLVVGVQLLPVPGVPSTLEISVRMLFPRVKSFWQCYLVVEQMIIYYWDNYFLILHIAPEEHLLRGHTERLWDNSRCWCSTSAAGRELPASASRPAAPCLWRWQGFARGELPGMWVPVPSLGTWAASWVETI